MTVVSVREGTSLTSITVLGPPIVLRRTTAAHRRRHPAEVQLAVVQLELGPVGHPGDADAGTARAAAPSPSSATTTATAGA